MARHSSSLTVQRAVKSGSKRRLVWGTCRQESPPGLSLQVSHTGYHLLWLFAVTPPTPCRGSSPLLPLPRAAIFDYSSRLFGPSSASVPDDPSPKLPPPPPSAGAGAASSASGVAGLCVGASRIGAEVLSPVWSRAGGHGESGPRHSPHRLTRARCGCRRHGPSPR